MTESESKEKEIAILNKDITRREDIELLITTFYTKAMADEEIKHFFHEVVKLDLERHIPHIADFWETVLLDNPVFTGNPMDKHIAMHAISPFTPDHFKRWLALFHQTTDELFTGDKAEMAKQRADSIALLMQYKIGILKGGI